MKLSEVTEIKRDILEAFVDFGTIAGEDNVTWLKQVPSGGDVYHQEVNKGYESNDIVALVTQRVPADELTILGLDKDVSEKLYIVADYFENLDIVPKESDRYIHKDVVFDVVKIKPIELANQALLYTIFGKEAPASAQSAEIREEDSPFEQIDAGVDPENADTSGVNADQYEDVQASVTCTEPDPFSFYDNINTSLSMVVNGVSRLITIPQGDYDMAGIVEELKTLIEAAFGAAIITVELVSGKIVIHTLLTGTAQVIEFKTVSASAYADLGITAGIYSGHRRK